MDQLTFLEQLDRVADACRRVGLAKLPPAGKRLLKPFMQTGVSVTVNGFEVNASIEHRHYLTALRMGEVESLMSKLFASVIRPGMIVFDIGAFVGWYTLLAARQVGSYGKVYAFEPDRRNYALLAENLWKNKLHDRVVAVPKAVSAGAGASWFFLHGGDQSRSSLFPSDPQAKKIVVDTVVLDDYFGAALTADVIKMDIEGGEMRALNGMERLLTPANRRVDLFVECNPQSLRLAGDSGPALVARLRELGFDLSIIDEADHSLAPLDSRIESAKYVNLYCTREP
jgi:FkbM family methyltransferase